MNKLRKFICTAIAALIILTGLAPLAPSPVYAAGSSGSHYYYYGEHKKYSAAEKYIAEELEDLADTIDVKKYKLKVKDFEEIMTDILLSRPDIFYIEPEYSYTTIKGSDYLISIKPEYYYAKTTINRRREELNSESDKLLAGLSDEWSDVQKALYIHDKLALTMEYDENNEVRSAYEGIVTKKALCVSYAMAYKFLMDKAGIPCVCVTSMDMAHCWNMAKIDGEWYHIDVTWDDLLPDFLGMVSHDLFMLSDEKIQNVKMAHYNWTYGRTADSTEYDDMFWRLTEAQIIPVTDNLWYYVDNYRGTLDRYSWSAGRSEKVCDIGMNWKDVEKGSNYTYNFSRLEISDNKLFFNTAVEIKSYDIGAKQVSSEKKRSSESGDIYGMKIENGTLKYECAASPLDYNSKINTAFEVSQKVPLDAPESFRGVASKGENSKYSIKLTWDKVKNADGYLIYRYNTSTKKAERIGETKKTAFTVNKVSKGRHSYVICAYKTINGQKIRGDFSSTVTKDLK